MVGRYTPYCTYTYIYIYYIKQCMSSAHICCLRRFVHADKARVCCEWVPRLNIYRVYIYVYICLGYLRTSQECPSRHAYCELALYRWLTISICSAASYDFSVGFTVVSPTWPSPVYAVTHTRLGHSACLYTHDSWPLLDQQTNW